MYQHRSKRCLITLLLSLHVAFPVRAQQTNPQTVVPPQTEDQDSATPNPPQASDPDKQPGFRRFFHDEYRIWTSPFRAGNYDSHTMKKYGVPFLLISGALIASDRKTADLLPNSQDQAVWSGRVSQIGASYTLAGMAGATYLIGKAAGDKHASETGFLGMASLVAVSRMGARRHWASDIFVGGSLGFLVGRYVYKHHHDPNLPGSPVHRTSRLIPTFTFGGREIDLYWGF